MTDTGIAVVMVVDDDALFLRVLGTMVAGLEGTVVRSFSKARDLLEAAVESMPDLVVTDVQMPEMDGIELIRALRATREGASLPIIAVTAARGGEVRRAALDAGVTDFLTKPLDMEETRARCRNLLTLRQMQRALSDRATWLAEEVRRATADIALRERETIMRLARAAEIRDWETGFHLVRIGEYVRLISRGLGLGPVEQDELWLAAPLHDVGKIGVPDYILRKPSMLSREEYAVMQQHTVLGHKLLSDSPSRLLSLGAEIALTHHERVDGTGYPSGLQGAAIPLSGRITAVADVFDALTSSRPYKAPWRHAEARAMLEQGAGTAFDADCVRAFTDQWSEVLEVSEQWSDEAQRGRSSGQIAQPLLA